MLSRSPGGRVPALTAAGRAWRSLPGRDRLVRKPHRQAAALAQGGIIRSRVGDLVLLLRNVVTAVLVQLERHGGHPRLRKGRSSYVGPARSATGGSMQQRHGGNK